jgi:hypothetical protein
LILIHGSDGVDVVVHVQVFGALIALDVVHLFDEGPERQPGPHLYKAHSRVFCDEVLWNRVNLRLIGISRLAQNVYLQPTGMLTGIFQQVNALSELHGAERCGMLIGRGAEVEAFFADKGDLVSRNGL